MTTSTHDVIEVVGRQVGDRPRVGEILEVLGEHDHPHYRVRWEDGHETMFYPGVGTRVRRAPAQVPAAARDLVFQLTDAGVSFELLPHPRTANAESEARVLGVLPQETAKTVVARADGRCVRAVVPASSRLSLDKLARVLEAVPTLLHEDELDGAYPQFELGAVPPFGGPHGDRIVVDVRLAASPHVVVEAGSHQLSLRLGGGDLVDFAGAEIADIAEGPEPITLEPRLDSPEGISV